LLVTAPNSTPRQRIFYDFEQKEKPPRTLVVTAVSEFQYGGDEGSRTLDLLNAIQGYTRVNAGFVGFLLVTC
jgi:hypothetical protein